MILPESKFWEDAVKDFCKFYALGSPPLFVTLYDEVQYIQETKGIEAPASYSPIVDRIALSPLVYTNPSICLHELAHHFQALADSLENFMQKYKEYTRIYGPSNNPYEVAANNFTRIWAPYFERFLRERK